jgi:hypothetical protein
VCAAELGLDPRTIRRWKTPDAQEASSEARKPAKKTKAAKASASIPTEADANVFVKKVVREPLEALSQSKDVMQPSAPSRTADRHATEEALANLPPRPSLHDDAAGGDSPVYGVLQAMALLQRNRAGAGAPSAGQGRPGAMPSPNRNAGAELSRAMMATRTNDALAIRKRNDAKAAWDLAQLPNAVRGTLQFLYNFMGVWGRRIMRVTTPTPESAVRPR